MKTLNSPAPNNLNFPQVAIMVILWTLFFYLAAYSASEHYVSVGGQSRIIRVSHEGNDLILRYFKDDNARLEFLGEEIFDKDGVKVYDSYIENNGMWPSGYEKRYRK